MTFRFFTLLKCPVVATITVELHKNSKSYKEVGIAIKSKETSD